MHAPPAPRSQRRLYSLKPGTVSPVFCYRYIFPAFFLFYISLSFLSDIGIIYTYNIQYMIFSVYHTDIKRVYTILFIYRRVRAACPPCPPLSPCIISCAHASPGEPKKIYIQQRPGREKKGVHARGPRYGTVPRACGRAIVALHGAAAIEAASGAATVARRRQSPPASAWSAKIVYNNDYILLLLSFYDKMTACKAWTPQKAPGRRPEPPPGGGGTFKIGRGDPGAITMPAPLPTRLFQNLIQ